MEQNDKKNMTGGTIFDDVFRTMAEKMPRLLIPLINEVFQKDYPENAHTMIQNSIIFLWIIKQASLYV